MSPEDRMAALAQSQSSNDYAVIGLGGYGIVVAPALPNTNNLGRRQTFPKNVTKIFHRVENRNKAIANRNRVRRISEKANIPVYPYQRRYTLRNLAPSIKGMVSHYLASTGKRMVTNDTELTLLRLPNLGVDFNAIARTPDYIQRGASLPYLDICTQIYKCMDVVKSFWDAGYIHADIRETNMLLDLETGHLTIIDFDWLKPVDDLYREYLKFFYPHPPECLFVWGRTLEDGRSVAMKNLNRTATVNTALYELVKKEGQDVYDSAEAGEAMAHFAETYPHPRHNVEGFRRGLFDIASSTIDSYGLAHALHYLFKQIWLLQPDASGALYQPEFGLFEEFGGVQTFEEYDKFMYVRRMLYEQFIPNMGHSNYRKRWTIDTALREFRFMMEQIGYNVEERMLALYPSPNPATAVASAVVQELLWMRMLADLQPSAKTPSPPSSQTVQQARHALDLIIQATQQGMHDEQSTPRKRMTRNAKNTRQTKKPRKATKTTSP